MGVNFKFTREYVYNFGCEMKLKVVQVNFKINFL
jgi:hypothetical protein